jgi:16S rRNA (guanine527-N7)-methyltransferase
VLDPFFGSKEFAETANVSRETLGRLEIYAGLLVEWNARQNLVATSTLPDMWRRHFWDSGQLTALLPAQARTLADLGSGAGFPGLVIAAMRPELKVTLHEATGKKCSFLREAASAMGVAIEICNRRIEELPPCAFDVVTARALAPLPQLLGYAKKFTGANSVCLFLKGQNLEVELTEASKYWSMKVSQMPSQTNPSAAILVVRELDPLNVSNFPTQKTAHIGRGQSKRRGR